MKKIDKPGEKSVSEKGKPAEKSTTEVGCDEKAVNEKSAPSEINTIKVDCADISNLSVRNCARFETVDFVVSSLYPIDVEDSISSGQADILRMYFVPRQIEELSSGSTIESVSLVAEQTFGEYTVTTDTGANYESLQLNSIITNTTLIVERTFGSYTWTTDTGSNYESLSSDATITNTNLVKERDFVSYTNWPVESSQSEATITAVSLETV